MINDSELLARFLQMQKALLASLRLKDVLDQAVRHFSQLAYGAKIAIFLSDNESQSFKLMAALGYCQKTLDEIKVLHFGSSSLLKQIIDTREVASIRGTRRDSDISSSIMKREASVGEVAMPLVSGNLLVGAILFDVIDGEVFDHLKFLKEVADVIALCVANAILFGRSEYERERLNTLSRSSMTLSGVALELNQVLQTACDTAVVVANTPTCALLLCDSEESFKLAAYKGLEGRSLKDFDLNVSETIAGRSLRRGRVEYQIDATGNFPGLPCATGGRKFASVLALPLVFANEGLGVIEIFSTDVRAFQHDQIELLESLAHQVANALYIALSHQSAAEGAGVDVHTGLYSGRQFEVSLHKEIERSQRHHHELSVMLIDIDYMSRVNEQFGHKRGDELLTFVAQIIKSALRDIDICCRYGGEEFAVVLPETSPPNALDVAERLRKKIHAQSVPGIGVVTVSIGVASYPVNAESPEALLHACEEALDIAKFSGRDKVQGAQTGSLSAADPISWQDLAEKARLSVVGDRQSRLQSRLAAAPEYAAWMTKTSDVQSFLKKKDNQAPKDSPSA